MFETQVINNDNEDISKTPLDLLVLSDFDLLKDRIITLIFVEFPVSLDSHFLMPILFISLV